MEKVNYTTHDEQNNMETNEVGVKFVLTKLLPDFVGNPLLAQGLPQFFKFFADI